VKSVPLTSPLLLSTSAPQHLCSPAQMLALESDVSGEVFQVASGAETSIIELAEMVQEVTGNSVEVSHGPARRGDVRKNYSAVDKERTSDDRNTRW